MIAQTVSLMRSSAGDVLTVMETVPPFVKIAVSQMLITEVFVANVTVIF